MDPKLSVIIPVYNAEKFLDKCINSILNQPYKDLEIVLVDDSSTDASAAICDGYAENYDFIKVIHKEHGGPIHTRKAGFLNSCGEYVSYIDSDDYIEPGMYEYMMKKILEHDADIGISDIVIETENSRIPLYKDIPEGFYDKEKLEKEVYPYMLYSSRLNEPSVIPSLCTKIIRRNVLEKVILNANESIYYGEDAICSYPCLLDANSAYIAKDKFFYIYRQTAYSITKKYDSRFCDKLKLLISILEAEFKKRSFEAETQLNCYISLQLVHCLRGELLNNNEIPLHERVKKMKEYLSYPKFKEVFDTAKQENIDKKLKAKLRLAENGHLYLLFLMFFLKEKILLLKEKHGERKKS